MEFLRSVNEFWSIIVFVGGIVWALLLNHFKIERHGEYIKQLRTTQLEYIMELKKTHAEYTAEIKKSQQNNEQKIQEIAEIKKDIHYMKELLSEIKTKL